jgi:hypothetical protein
MSLAARRPCLGYRLAGAQAEAGVAQQAELHGEAEPVGGAAPGADEREVRLVQDVVPGHLGAVGRDAEQAGALLGGQQGAAGHGVGSGRRPPRRGVTQSCCGKVYGAQSG